MNGRPVATCCVQLVSAQSYFKVKKRCHKDGAQATEHTPLQKRRYSFVTPFYLSETTHYNGGADIIVGIMRLATYYDLKHW